MYDMLGYVGAAVQYLGVRTPPRRGERGRKIIKIRKSVSRNDSIKEYEIKTTLRCN